MSERLSVAAATVKFLAAQQVSRDGQTIPMFAGMLGIFGHGNLTGIGAALAEQGFRYVLGRNEQALVHTAVAYARARQRRQMWAVTTSIGPGATNLVTGAALATVNRLPVLLLPGDTFATRACPPVLQELESGSDVTVNDALRPVSRFFDRVQRPEQLPAALVGAMRVLTDPAETGAATIALPQDVATESYDWPEELFAERIWHIPRTPPDPDALARAAAVIQGARTPLLVAGGGVVYSEATTALRNFAEATGIPVALTQAGKGALAFDHPLCAGALGTTGTPTANRLAADADVVIGIGTRYSDFTTASRSAFAHPDVRFVNVNVAAFDAAKLSAVAVVADARAGLARLQAALPDYRADVEVPTDWHREVESAYAADELTQVTIMGMVEAAGGTVVCAAGSMPGELHRLWRAHEPEDYHVEYGYSCMGYEIAGGLGVKLAHPEREVFVLVGDGSYLMMSSEIVTSLELGAKLVVVLVDNGGFASIGALSEATGSDRFGTTYAVRPDLGANAASLGAQVFRPSTKAEFAAALAQARAATQTTVLYVRTDQRDGAPPSQSWWDVPVPETSRTHADYVTAKRRQRPLLRPPERHEQ